MRFDIKELRTFRIHKQYANTVVVTVSRADIEVAHCITPEVAEGIVDAMHELAEWRSPSDG